MTRWHCERRVFTWTLTLLAAGTVRSAAQQSTPVALLPTALYTAQANVQEPADTAKAALATTIIRTKLTELLPRILIDSATTAAATMRPDAIAAAGGQPCHVIVACARAVGTAVGARWAVMTKVSKTSNLIWLFTGQLIDLASGKIILDDSTELKGEPDAMVRAGARIFAERVARAVRAGGPIGNFPSAPAN